MQVDDCFDLIPESFSAFDNADDIGMNLEPCGSLSAGESVSTCMCNVDLKLCCPHKWCMHVLCKSVEFAWLASVLSASLCLQRAAVRQ